MVSFEIAVMLPVAAMMSDVCVRCRDNSRSRSTSSALAWDDHRRGVENFRVARPINLDGPGNLFLASPRRRAIRLIHAKGSHPDIYEKILLSILHSAGADYWRIFSPGRA